MIVSVFCPICGHHLVGHNDENSKTLNITAYCPICNNKYLFEEHQNIQENTNGDNDE